MAAVFFSYCHIDEGLRNELEQHLAVLKRNGQITAWHDRRILAGDHFADVIDRHIEEADIILLLISPAFLASDYCYEREMQRAIERNAEGSARVIPVILRPCDWKDSPFGKLLAAPTDGKPVTTWTNKDEAFIKVAESIKQTLVALHQRSASAQPARAR